MKRQTKTQFWTKTYRVTGDGFPHLYRLIKDNDIHTENMQEKDGALTVELRTGNNTDFLKICKENGFETKLVRKGDALSAISWLAHRPGLIIGFILIITTVIFLHNIVMRFDIMCDNEEICTQIMNVLKEENVTAGSFIPDINLVVTERALKQKVDGISWAGITRKGNTLIIDVVETIEKPKGYSRRLPSNIIATENAVIDDVDVLDGQLKYGVGCGICKGDILVSGEIITSKSKWVNGKEEITTKTRYARSIASINGTFERKVIFEQPLEDKEKFYTGEQKTQSYFHLFSADIPLFLSKAEGKYTTNTTTTCPQIFGVQLPFGIKKMSLSEYDYKPVIYSKDEAQALASEKSYKYEQNFLDDYDILDRTTNVSVENNILQLEVTYRLYGTIGKEVAFFIKK